METASAISGEFRESSAPTRSKEHERLGVWFLVLCLVLTVLVMVGGIVRISGSGLSIPEWPIINGSLLPPLTEDGWRAVYYTYYREIHGVELSGPLDSHLPDRLSLPKFQMMFAIEYTHRFLAAVVGMIFLALLVQVFRQASLRRELGKRMVFMAILLLAQAVLGGIVVKYDLRAEFVAVHLGLAFAFFGLVFWTALRLLAYRRYAVRLNHPLLFRLAWVALAAVYLQILSGGMVAGTYAGFLFNTWPLMNGQLIPDTALLWSANILPHWMNLLKNQVLIQFIHRWWAWGATLSIFAVMLCALRLPLSERARYAIRSLGFLIVLQVLLGIMTLVAKVPAILAISHLMVGFLIFAVLVFLVFELKYGTLKMHVTTVDQNE